MIVCARCGAQNQPTNKFCLSCGAPVQQQAPAAPQANPGPSPGYGAPPGWGQGQPPAQPHHHAPPGASPYGQPGQQQQPPGAWGAPPQQAPPGGYAPAPGGYGPAPDQHRVGSPDGLNPFGATVGPPQGYGQGYPQPGAPHAPPPQQQHHGTPGPQGAQPGHWGPPPAQPAQGEQGVAYAATSPPPTADDYNAQAGAPAAHGHGQAPHAPAPHRSPSAPPPGTVGASPQAGRDPEHLDPNAPRALAGFLVSYEGNELGAFFPIHQGQNLVGRKGAAPGLNIELEHGTTSSRHAVLSASARPGRIKIEDVGSTNGTFVGDLMLERGKKHELKDGDVVRFGGYVTIVKIV